MRRNLLYALMMSVFAVCFSGCGNAKDPNPKEQAAEPRAQTALFKVGEAIVVDGGEIAHVNILIGDKQGPVGTAFAKALADQKAGHPVLLALMGPNVVVKPPTVIVPVVTIAATKQTVQIYGPVQDGVARGIAETINEGTIPKEACTDLVIVCTVFVSKDAEDDKKLFRSNLAATKLALKRAWTGEPSLEEALRYKAKQAPPWE